jgi:hypothetical protein
MPAYGKKSDPPRKAIKEMISKHSESSSKDALHSSLRHRKAKVKRAR